MEENQDLVDISYAANLLGVSKLTLRNWDNSGILKAMRLGTRGDRRYRKKDIEAFSEKTKDKNQLPEIDREKLMEFLDKEKFWFQEGSSVLTTIEPCPKAIVESGIELGPGYSFCLFPGEKEYFKQVLSISESIKTCRSHLEIIRKNPQKMKDFIKKTDESIISLRRVIDRLDFVDLEKLSQENLLKEFFNFIKELDNFWRYTLFVEPYDIFLEQEYLPKFEKSIGEQKKAREVFSILTFPLELSFIAQERKDFLGIVLSHFKNAKERKALIEMMNEDYLLDIKYRNPNLFDEINKHQKNYFWTQNSYAQSVVLKINDFINFIKETLKASSIEELENEFIQLKNQNRDMQKKQEELIKSLNIEASIVNEMKHLQKMTCIKDERKKTMLIMVHYFFNFLKEFSKRSNVDFKLICYASIKEIPDILQKNFDLNILQRRSESLIAVAQRGHEPSVITGNDAVIIKNKLFPEKNIDQEYNEIHGSVACRGGSDSVIGIAKVVLEAKDQTISNSDILVTSMTRPEFVPLMRKAKAVVTDEGGITCHAAIISREMNKPCIIGTKNATRFIKTGDEIELRMNHGIILIKKKLIPQTF